MCLTRVVNINKETYDVNIMRPTKWGNPFIIGKDGTRKEVIAKYRMWVRSQPHLMASLGELRGKTLGCCCKPKPCHGDVLVDLIREMEADEVLEIFSVYLQA